MPNEVSADFTDCKPQARRELSFVLPSFLLARLPLGSSLTAVQLNLCNLRIVFKSDRGCNRGVENFQRHVNIFFRKDQRR